MSGRQHDLDSIEVVGYGKGTAHVATTPRDRRRAAVRVADAVAAEYPHPLDILMPRLAGRELAQRPVIAAGVRELLQALGLAAAQTKEVTRD